MTCLSSVSRVTCRSLSRMPQSNPCRIPAPSRKPTTCVVLPRNKAYPRVHSILSWDSRLFTLHLTLRVSSSCFIEFYYPAVLFSWWSWTGGIGNTRGSLWIDTVFGGFSEWFGYADTRDHPSISPDGWRRLARSVGFVDFQHYTEIGGGWKFLFNVRKPPVEESSFGATILDHHFLT